MKKPALRLFLHWIPAMAGILVIVAESTIFFGAGNTSRWLLPVWERLFGPVAPERWEVIHFYIRKTGHFVGYGLVSLGFFEGWRATFSPGKDWARLLVAAALPALFSTLLLAMWDEWHQSFLPGRTSSPVDVGIDFSGAVMAHLVLLLVLTVVWKVRSSRASASSGAVPVVR
ncbi:MAG: VanZ family protein [Acidobacterium ailaaui]|nr:VanZ family protein [Pseudacidobacterium ailaaui]